MTKSGNVNDAKILLGNCLDVMKTVPDGSIDAVVTDPPYGLSKQPDIAEVMKHWLAGDTYEHKAKGFMGKSWDSFVPGPEYWREVFSVMKPGAHLVAFSGTRTYDLLVVAIRFAGFEIRDQLQWLYGSGFPKSLNISKAIGKSANVDGAEQWKGWGTALKPAHEPICVARKPLSESTVAANVLKWGIGGLNINECRIGYAEHDDRRVNKSYTHNAAAGIMPGTKKDNHKGASQVLHNKTGRWPANVILDEEAGAILDEQSGVTTSGAMRREVKAYKGTSTVKFLRGMSGPNNQHGDTGGASRFFYSAKTSKKERHLGTEGLYWNAADEQISEKEWRSLPEKERRQGNIHATVKPVALMRYLVRLVTPHGGTVLDPFMGSGSTGVAAIQESFKFIGVEMELSSLTIAKARIEYAQQTPDEEVKKKDKKPKKAKAGIAKPPWTR